MNEATSAGFTDRRKNNPTPMAISMMPKRATQSVVPWESRLAVWLMVELIRLGWPAAIGRMTSETNVGLKRFGWNFKSPSMIQIAPSAHCSVRWFTCSDAAKERRPVAREGDPCGAVRPTVMSSSPWPRGEEPAATSKYTDRSAAALGGVLFVPCRYEHRV